MIEWQQSWQSDLIGPDRPDVLIDCDGNFADDVDEIDAGLKLDVNQDLVPDVCQVFVQPDDLVVSGMNSSDRNRPRFYDGTTGAYRGDLWNGMTWTHNLRFGQDGLIYMPRLTLIERLDVRTGRTVDNFVDGVLEGASVFVDVLFDDVNHLLVLCNCRRPSQTAVRQSAISFFFGKPQFKQSFVGQQTSYLRWQSCKKNSCMTPINCHLLSLLLFLYSRFGLVCNPFFQLGQRFFRFRTSAA